MTAKQQPQRPPSVSDALGIQPFHPDLARVGFRDLVDTEVIIEDAIIIDNFETDYGTHDLALIQVTIPESGEMVTTACSGQVVVKKVRQLLDRGLLPVSAVFTHEQRYYDMK